MQKGKTNILGKELKVSKAQAKKAERRARTRWKTGGHNVFQQRTETNKSSNLSRSDASVNFNNLYTCGQEFKDLASG